MEVVFIDPEPPDMAGGGIRSYLRLAMATCREQGINARLYTHNPNAFPGEKSTSIGRKSWLPRPIRGLAYRFQYSETVLWEYAYWIAIQIKAIDSSDKVYEFADYLGYGFFALRNLALRKRIVLRIHTPRFMIPTQINNFQERVASLHGKWREQNCLSKAIHISVPSAEFIREQLPYLRRWTHVPNLLPKLFPLEKKPVTMDQVRFLYLGRVEPRKGVLILVRAFLTLARENPEATLTLVGGQVPGEYGEIVRELITSQSKAIQQRLTWSHSCTSSERDNLLSGFNVLVAPSLWENSPYVYFEGMAAGLLCLGSSTGEMKAVSKITNGPSALPGDENDWLRAMREVVNGEHWNAVAKQTTYLESKREDIPIQLMSFFRAIADP